MQTHFKQTMAFYNLNGGGMIVWKTSDQQVITNEVETRLAAMIGFLWT